LWDAERKAVLIRAVLSRIKEFSSGYFCKVTTFFVSLQTL